MTGTRGSPAGLDGVPARRPQPARPCPLSCEAVEQRRLGASGLRVSRLALGTMTWGRDTDADEAGASLLAFLDAGGTLVDTADVYADGEAEAILGGLFADVIPRTEVVLATKAGARRTGRPPGGHRPSSRARPRCGG